MAIPQIDICQICMSLCPLLDILNPSEMSCPLLVQALTKGHTFFLTINPRSFLVSEIWGGGGGGGGDLGRR